MNHLIRLKKQPNVKVDPTVQTNHENLAANCIKLNSLFDLEVSFLLHTLVPLNLLTIRNSIKKGNIETNVQLSKHCPEGLGC